CHFFAPPLPVAERRVFVASLGGAALLFPAFRAAFERVTESPLWRRTVLVLGGGALAAECGALIARGHRLQLAGVLVQEGEAAPPGVAVLGSYADVTGVCADHQVDRVVVASSERRGTLPVAELVDLKLGGVAIEEGIDFYEKVTGKIFVP